MQFGTLYLVPNFLSADSPNNYLPEYIRQSIHHIKNFVVESEKEGRRLIKRLRIETPQSELRLFLLNEHSRHEEYVGLLDALKNGGDAALMSDAGIPCVADPGFQLVKICHQKNIKVIPLPGASSIFMALMASGFNGQQFTFHGYLPLDKNARVAQIREMEKVALVHDYCQIFMETPYRNRQLLAQLCETCKAETLLCIAADIGGSGQFIQTKRIRNWKEQNPDLHKIPAIFILGGNT